MARPELGTKRICVECDAKFYDLGKVPYICPICQYEHAEKAVTPPEEIEAKAEPSEEAETEDDELDIEAPVGVDVISLDEAETEDAGDEDLAALSDEELPDVPDDDSNEGEDSDVFLEEDEDDPNVSDLIGGVGPGSNDD